jgi:hypothetical protein
MALAHLAESTLSSLAKTRTGREKADIPRPDLLCDPGAPIAYGLAVAIATLYLLYLMTPDFLAGRGGILYLGDVAQHVSGWLFFAKDAWRFPLLHTIRLNYPEGTSIVFTDSIPLAALVLKPFASMLPGGFHYLGIWHAVALISQAVAATMLIRALGVRHLVTQVSAVFFALTWPALTSHLCALMTHSLLIFSLACYFLGRRGRWTGRAAYLALLGVCIAAMLVHIYLMAMCFAVLLAYLGDQALAGEGVGRQVFRLGLALCLIAVLAVILGYFPGGSPSDGGMGIYSLNLTAPFLGGLFTGPAIDATGGQSAGTCYFGVGGLLLCGIALLSRFSEIAAWPRRYPALFAVLVFFVIFACSNRVYFGRTELFHAELPVFLERLAGIFRCSGRFIWLPTYVILFGALGGAMTGKTSRIAAVACLAVALQWIDLGPVRDAFRSLESIPAPRWSGDWNKALAGVREILVYPPAGGDDYTDSYVKYQLLAAEHGTLINTGYIARAGKDQRAKELAFEAHFSADDLYILPKRHLASHPLDVFEEFYLAADRGECGELEGDIVCRPGQNLGVWRDQGFAIEPFPGFPNAGFGMEKFSSQVGARRDATLEAGPSGQAGLLAYGPFTRLSPGRYRFYIEYQGFAPRTQRLGWWDCMTGSDLAFAQGDLAGTEGEVERIEAETRVDAPRDFYLHAYYLGGAQLRLVRVGLQRLPARSGDWDDALAGVRSVHVYAPGGCQDHEQAPARAYAPLPEKYGPIGAGASATGESACRAEQQALGAEFSADELYIMPKRRLRLDPLAVPAGYQRAANRGECVDLDGAIVCRPGKNLEFWRARGFAAAPFAGFAAARFGVERLSTEIGVVRDAKLTAGPHEQAGFLAYGPHVRLSPGRYRFEIEYQGFASKEQRLGWWDCLIGTNAPYNPTVAGGDLHGTDGAVEHIEGETTVMDTEGTYFDLRAFYLGGEKLCLLSVGLYRLP